MIMLKHCWIAMSCVTIPLHCNISGVHEHIWWGGIHIKSDADPFFAADVYHGLSPWWRRAKNLKLAVVCRVNLKLHSHDKRQSGKAAKRCRCVSMEWIYRQALRWKFKWFQLWPCYRWAFDAQPIRLQLAVFTVMPCAQPATWEHRVSCECRFSSQKSLLLELKPVFVYFFW